MFKKYGAVLPILVLFLQINNAISQQYIPKREFRGVWIATVENIDWPSKTNKDSEVQKKELIGILDHHQKSGINAIIFQVRPSADALYAEGREPWSRYLSGKQGQAPVPFFDPLKFAISEAHKRGMELHAWFNPYRATMDLVDSTLADNHITRIHPEWFFNYGGKKLFNPGLPQVREYIVEVIMNVVRKYDIDGVHFDDYFYPYPGREQLQDSLTYNLYGKNFLNIDDWRRNNVDTLIRALSLNIHSEKRYVKFGISPFGIWRNSKEDPEGSESNGLSGYSALYADARKWCREGWVDYIVPQLYWTFENKAAAFGKLMDWWSYNAFNKHLYVGHGAYRAESDKDGWQNKSQLSDQVRLLRNNFRVQGSVYFSSRSLINNLAGFADSLTKNFYNTPALQPAMMWLDDVMPIMPKKLTAMVSGGKIRLNWQKPAKSADDESVYGYVVYRFSENEPINLDDSRKIVHIGFDSNLLAYDDISAERGKVYRYCVTSIDRLKNESLPSNVISIKTAK